MLLIMHWMISLGISHHSSCNVSQAVTNCIVATLASASHPVQMCSIGNLLGDLACHGSALIPCSLRKLTTQTATVLHLSGVVLVLLSTFCDSKV